MVHYVIVGAASLPFVNAPEARLLTGTEPTDASLGRDPRRGIVAMLLPRMTAGLLPRGRSNGDERFISLDGK